MKEKSHMIILKHRTEVSYNMNKQSKQNKNL